MPKESSFQCVHCVYNIFPMPSSLLQDDHYGKLSLCMVQKLQICFLYISYMSY